MKTTNANVENIHKKKAIVLNNRLPIQYLLQDYLSSIAFQAKAAIAAPMNGPTIKIQRLVSAVPPWNNAGAIERAGFTEVPV